MKHLSKKLSHAQERKVLTVLAVVVVLITFIGITASLKGALAGIGTNVSVTGPASARKGNEITYRVTAQYAGVQGRTVTIETRVRVPWGFTYVKKGNAANYCDFNPEKSKDMEHGYVACKQINATPSNGTIDMYMISFKTDGTDCDKQDAYLRAVTIIQEALNPKKMHFQSPNRITKIRC